MEYKEFLCEIKEKVEEICAEDIKVNINSVRKNNTTMLDAILLQKEGEIVTPTIYLNDFYNDYQNGRDMDDIVHNILDIYESNRFPFDCEMENMFNLENMADKIIFKIINTEKNNDLISECPHRDFMDLTIVYCCLWDNIRDSFATSIINNEHIKKWGINEEYLFQKAYENTKRICKPILKNIEDIIIELYMANKNCEPDIFDNIDFDRPIFVLTNKNKIYGAVNIIYNDFLKDFANEHGNFFIIPSSVHEVLLIPDEFDVDEEYLLDTIQMVNTNELSKEEYLSDNLYMYDVESDNIKVIYNKKNQNNVKKNQKNTCSMIKM